MGGALGETQEQASQSIAHYFHELFAYFLSIGMSSHEYWEEEPELVNDYIKAETIRQTKLNNQLWLQGIYNRLAIGSCLSKSVKYPEQPMPLTEAEKESKKNQRVEKLKSALKAKSKK